MQFRVKKHKAIYIDTRNSNFSYKFRIFLLTVTDQGRDLGFTVSS